MQFMLMCCFDGSRWGALPDAERDELMHAYDQWVQRQVANGHYLGGGKLDESHTARTVRVREGKPQITDGPFAEAKEQIGGYHVVECADYDAAVALAQTVPTLPAGGTIEVRPLLHRLGAGS